MFRTSLMAAIAIPLLSTGAVAQNTTIASHACQFNGLSFSIGSTVSLGKAIHRCEWSDNRSLPRWYRVNQEKTLPDGSANVQENIEASANCLYANAFYGNGSMIVVRDKVLVCSQGAWFESKE